MNLKLFHFLTLLLLALGSAHEESGEWHCDSDEESRIVAEFRPGRVTLDGHADDWADIDGFDFPLLPALDPDNDHQFGGGKMTVKALHDGKDVYFMLQVDGDYAYTKGCSSRDCYCSHHEIFHLKGIGLCLKTRILRKLTRHARKDDHNSEDSSSILTIVISNTYYSIASEHLRRNLGKINVLVLYRATTNHWFIVNILQKCLAINAKVTMHLGNMDYMRLGMGAKGEPSNLRSYELAEYYPIFTL
nr:Cell wall protein [Ipomoea batatas]